MDVVYKFEYEDAYGMSNVEYLDNAAEIRRAIRWLGLHDHQYTVAQMKGNWEVAEIDWN